MLTSPPRKRMFLALQSRCAITRGPSAARRTFRSLPRSARSTRPLPGRREIEQGIVGGTPEAVGRHPAWQSGQVPERCRHATRCARAVAIARRSEGRSRSPARPRPGIRGARRGPRRTAEVPRAPPDREASGGEERLHRVRVAQECHGRRGRPRLQEHAAPLVQREPEGRPDADHDAIDAVDAGATQGCTAVHVDAREDRGRVVCAEDRAREQAVVRVAQGCGPSAPRVA